MYYKRLDVSRRRKAVIEKTENSNRNSKKDQSIFRFIGRFSLNVYSSANHDPVSGPARITLLGSVRASKYPVPSDTQSELKGDEVSVGFSNTPEEAELVSS